MRIIETNNSETINKIMRGINVDAYGIKIMSPKASSLMVEIPSISNPSANILKQQMLSLGADAAVSRSSLTGQIKKTPCILIGNLSQFHKLQEKMKLQPFGMADFAKQLKTLFANYQRNSFTVDLGSTRLHLKEGQACLMGILNITPDSFSNDGLYQNNSIDTGKILDAALSMVKEKAQIIDVGGESSRPQAKPVSEKEQLRRVIPVIKLLAKKIRIPISIDTYKPEVAKAALDNGAAIVNDISGLRDKKMPKVIARYKAAVVIMHMRNRPSNMQKNISYANLIADIKSFLSESINKAHDASIPNNKIIIDPGIGFGKTLEHNLEILNRLREFKTLGMPVLIGPSRKSFIGNILGIEDPQKRINGTIAACLLAVKNGVNILRIHDIKQINEALKIWEAASKIWNS
ncbi:MAG: dihydropteroate synthase [Candidatus Omnitrophica bacterium]|nr:dihydropteroate synthase [Candidatus Omnitrophota bacterium]